MPVENYLRYLIYVAYRRWESDEVLAVDEYMNLTTMGVAPESLEDDFDRGEELEDVQAAWVEILL